MVWILNYMNIATIYPICLEHLFFFLLVGRTIALCHLLSVLDWLMPAQATGSDQAVCGPDGGWACTDEL